MTIRIFEGNIICNYCNRALTTKEAFKLDDLRYEIACLECQDKLGYITSGITKSKEKLFDYINNIIKKGNSLIMDKGNIKTSGFDVTDLKHEHITTYEKRAEYVYKIVSAGDGGVGKTTLLHKYVDGRFFTDIKSTIGLEVLKKKYYLDNMDFILSLWDFGGQNQFRFLLKQWVKGINGALVMFDLSRPNTLINIGEWIALLRSENETFPIILIGTKADLIVGGKSEISDIAEEIVNEYNLLSFIHTSSKENLNIDQCFSLLIKEIYDTIS